VVELDLRVFALERLGDDVPPQTGAREHVGLVNREDGERGVDRDGDLCGHAGDALDLPDAVGHFVPRDVLVGRDVLFLAFAKVEPPDELAYDDDVDAFGDRLLQGRVDDERVGGKVARADVGVEAEGFAEGEQAGLRANFTVDAPFGAANGAYGGCEWVRAKGERGEEVRCLFRFTTYPSGWHLLLCMLAGWKQAVLHRPHRSHILRRDASRASARPQTTRQRVLRAL
jgi:hypothetical protein